MSHDEMMKKSLWNVDVKQFNTKEKILRHPTRIKEWLNGKNPFPIMVEFDMTNECNHHCPDCIAGHYKKQSRDFLSAEFAKNVISQLAEGGLKGISFTGGGEPFCNSDTPEVIQWAKRCGLDVVIVTNGSFLNKGICEVIIENCIGISISLDAGSPETFTKMHGRESDHFFEILENIRRLVETKKDLGGECRVGVAILTCDATMEEMYLATATAKDLGVDYIQFRPLMIHRGGKFEYHWADVSGEIETCLTLAEKGKFDVLFSRDKYRYIGQPNSGRNYIKCFGHQFAGAIGADGRVYLCCHLRGYPMYILGDLHQESFQEIWNSERRQQAINSIDFKNCVPLCRCNAFNGVLWEIYRNPSKLDAGQIKKPILHENIL